MVIFNLRSARTNRLDRDSKLSPASGLTLVVVVLFLVLAMAQPGKQALAQSEARGQGLQPAVNLGQSAQASNFQAVSRANHSLQTQTQTGTPPVTQVQVVEQTDPPRSWLDTTTKVVLISIVPVVIVGVIMALITILRRGHHKL